MTTEHHSAESLQKKHLVNFDTPKPIDNLHYYDFGSKKWIPCKIFEYLPYNLAMYEFKNKLIVTSTDSYRLSVDPTNVTIDFEAEAKWRNEIVLKGAELDVYDVKQKKWKKGLVRWTKADIVEGIILIGPRLYDESCPQGYYYKESSNLAKSCTYTDPISQDVLDKEIEAKKMCDENNQKCETWKRQFKVLAVNGLKRCSFYDIRPFYQQLTKYPDAITLDIVQALINEKIDETQDLAILWMFMRKDKKYQICFKHFEEPITNYKYHTLKFIGDAVANIQIYNATYAKYYPSGDFSEWLQSIDLVKREGHFTLPEVTYNNPLFKSIFGAHIIETDGNRIEYDQIYLDPDESQIFHGFENSTAVTWMGDKISVCNHSQMPNLCCDVQKIIELK